MLRLVLDTNVVASAIYWPGAPRLLLQAARDKQIQIFTSTPMLVELADVLARAKFKRKRAALKLPPEELAARASLIVAGDKPLLSVSRYQTVEIITTAHTLQRVAA
jgi:predicted nucleic acid-binding protein